MSLHSLLRIKGCGSCGEISYWTKNKIFEICVCIEYVCMYVRSHINQIIPVLDTVRTET